MINIAIIFDERGIPITSANPFPVSVKGSNRVQTLTQADAVGDELTFDAAIDYIEIVNLDGTNTGVFVVNGQTIPVPPRTAVGPERVDGTPSAVVEVTGSTSYIVVRRT